MQVRSQAFAKKGNPKETGRLIYPAQWNKHGIWILGFVMRMSGLTALRLVQTIFSWRRAKNFWPTNATGLLLAYTPEGGAPHSQDFNLQSSSHRQCTINFPMDVLYGTCWRSATASCCILLLHDAFDTYWFRPICTRRVHASISLDLGTGPWATRH